MTDPINRSEAAYTPQVPSEPITGQPLAPAMYVVEGETDRVDREAEFYGASKGLALKEIFEDAQITGRLGGYLEAERGRTFERQREIVFGVDRPLSAEEANDRFGVPGRLSFDKPVSASIAAWQQGLAQREAFREEVVANADVGPLEALGASLAGSILDPAGIPLWLVPELATGRALRAGVAASRLGRMGSIQRGVVTGALEGTAGGLAYEGVNLWLHNEGAEDYSFGEALTNVALGGVLGGAIGGGGGWWEGRTRGRAPAVVEQLSPEGRTGAFAEALDAAIEDRSVDLAPMLARQAEATTKRRVPREAAPELDEIAGAEPSLTARYLDGAALGETAVTPRGVEVPVRFALVEAEDLITSHDDDLFPTSDYPTALQPRRRDRAGAQARNRQLEGELNPKRLIGDVGAETGAPIVARDGVVESGNGRSIAIRRSYRTGSGAAQRYRAELEGQGFDTTGMEAPVLVRVRSSTLSGGERAQLARDMNAEATEAYSPSERAASDAAEVDDDLLGLVAGPDLNAAGNRRFVKGFLDKVASDDLNRMTTADGRLSEAGMDRIGAAMVARAYGDRGLVEALFETTDSQIKAIGKALVASAPEWASMRAAAARGEVPEALDVTPPLVAAVNFVRQVRGRGGNLAETLDLTIGQYDAFAGSAMTPETEAFIRSFFRTSKEGATLWRSPRGAESLADGLRWMAGEIKKAQPGPNLFGETADEGTARSLLDAFGQWFGRQDTDEPAPGLAFDGPDPTQPAGRDVRPDGDAAGRVGGGSAAGGEAALLERPEPKPKVAKGEAPKPPAGDPYADPEVVALAADTEAALVREGLDPADIAAATPPAQDPQTVADAVSAAAFCLKGA